MQHQRRGPWSVHEDQHLLTLVQIHGPHNWVRISQQVGTRSPKQCRERYHQNLKPQLNHDPITPEEGELIERLVGEMGKRWAEIARRLKGRSDNAVKNWWNGGVNRRRRMVVRQRIDNRVQDDRRRAEEPMSPYSMMYQHHHHHHHHAHAHHHRHPEDALPSPPLSSSMSRADSKEPTPSLVSDNYSSISSASPRLPGSPMNTQLPPIQFGAHRQHSPNYSYGNTLPLIRRNSHSGDAHVPSLREQEPKKMPFDREYDAYYVRQSREPSDASHYQYRASYDAHRPTHLQVNTKPQSSSSHHAEPITPVHSQAPSSIPTTPASPNKDDRMNICSILG